MMMRNCSCKYPWRKNVVIAFGTLLAFVTLLHIVNCIVCLSCPCCSWWKLKIFKRKEERKNSCRSTIIGVSSWPTSSVPTLLCSPDPPPPPIYFFLLFQSFPLLPPPPFFCSRGLLATPFNKKMQQQTLETKTIAIVMESNGRFPSPFPGPWPCRPSATETPSHTVTGPS